MEQILSLATARLLMLIPTILNIVITILLFATAPYESFMGYFAGTFLCAVLSYFWILQARSAQNSQFLSLVKITLGGFLVKFILFSAFLFFLIPALNLNRISFAIAFLLGTIISMAIELYFFFRLISSIKKRSIKSGQRAAK